MACGRSHGSPVAKGSLLQAQVEMYKRLEKAAGEDAEVGDPCQRI